MLRITASPHAVSAGFAAGVAASITPFIGLHILLSFVIAFFVRGNMLAAALGTAVGNPITFPFIWTTTFNFGSWLLGGNQPAFDASSVSLNILTSSIDVIWTYLKPMLIGCIPLGITMWLISYLAIRKIVSVHRVHRQRCQLVRCNQRAGFGRPRIQSTSNGGTPVQ